MHKIKLPAFYYLDNFIQLLDHVFEYNKAVFREDDFDDFLKFKDLSKNAQALFTRFLMRKGNYFRPTKIVYKEIPNIAECLVELEAVNFISWDVPVEEKIKLFTKPELCDLFPDFKLKALPRAQIDEVLIGHVEQITERVLALERDFFVFRLLYFGNAHQDLSEFILNDLGIYQYENYSLSQGFIKSEEELSEFLRFYESIAEYDSEAPHEFLENHQIIKSDNRVLKRRLNKFYFRLGRQLERKKFLDQALEIYELSTYSGERKARVLAEQKRYEEMEAQCLKILRTSQNDQEHKFARFFLAKNAKYLKSDYKKESPFIARTETIQLDQTELSVEMSSCEYFSQFGKCYYSENLWIKALFGLFFWEVIFADVSGAFSHPFQHRPHDLYEDDFCEVRKDLIEEVFNSDFTWEKGEGIFDEKFGLSNSFVAWNLVKKENLRLAIESFEEAQLKSIFREFLKDLRAKPKGFPDLILFPEQGGVELIEIKGPGDRLQKHQSTWLEFFDKQGIKARVVNVQWN